jgi:hypothetical protein
MIGAKKHSTATTAAAAAATSECFLFTSFSPQVAQRKIWKKNFYSVYIELAACQHRKKALSLAIVLPDIIITVLQ